MAKICVALALALLHYPMTVTAPFPNNLRRMIVARPNPTSSPEFNCAGKALDFACIDGSHGTKDGLLDLDELALRVMIHQHVRNVDRNHDGRISAREAFRYSRHVARQHTEIARIYGAQPPTGSTEENQRWSTKKARCLPA